MSSLHPGILGSPGYRLRDKTKEHDEIDEKQMQMIISSTILQDHAYLLANPSAEISPALLTLSGEIAALDMKIMAMMLVIGEICHIPHTVFLNAIAEVEKEAQAIVNNTVVELKKQLAARNESKK